MDEREKPSPFTEFAGRVAQVPVRAVQLPFQLLNEAIGTPEAVGGRLAEDIRRQKAAELTGRPAEYSEGRRWANALSLGLIPNNPSSAIDPSQLDPEQRAKFERMNPLMQALMQSKRPSDYAALLADDALFAEPEAKPLESVPAGNRLYDPNTDETLLEPVAVPLDPTAADKNVAAAGASRAAAEASSAKAEVSRGELSLFDGKRAKLEAEIRKLDAQAEAARKGDAAEDDPASLKTRSKIAGMENSVLSRFNARTKDLERGFTAARNAYNLFEMREQPPAEMASELSSLGFKLSPNTEPRALQDMMFMVTAVRITDPPGRISDSEQKIYSAARSRFDPDIVAALIEGRPLTNPQRNEMMLAIKKQTRGMVQANDAAVVDARKEMLRDRVKGNGLGMNPINVPDPGAQLREMYFGEGLGDQAAFPAADDEAEALIEQLWAIAHPDGRRPASEQEFVDFVNAHGFRVRDTAP